MRKIVAYERKPGLWEAKGINPNTGQRKSYYGKSQAEAERKALLSYGVQVDDDKLYSFYANVYLPTVAHRSQNWLKQIAWAMDKYVLPVFGNHSIHEITRAQLQPFFNKLPMKTSSKRRVKVIFSSVLNLAEADDIILKNPVRYVRIPTDDPTNKRALTFDQLHTLIEAAKGTRALPIVLLAGCCGMRIGECCGTSWAEIEGDTLKVRYQLVGQKGGVIRTSTLKTPQSRRDIPLPKGLLELLQNNSMWVCADRIGGALNHKQATSELRAVLKKAGLGEYVLKDGKKVFKPMVTPHELRHTFISLMENELEAPQAIVACLAGRKFAGLNAGYSHTHRKQLERWMGRYWERASTCVRQDSVVQSQNS